MSRPELEALIWPDSDDVGYEFWREAQMAAAEEAPAVLRLVPALPPLPLAATLPVRCGVCRSKVARCFCPFAAPEDGEEAIAS